VAGRVPALGHHLLLDQRERHGDQHQPEQQVAAARDHLQLAVLRVRALERFAGHQVAEPDGGQRDEAEVRAVDERPALPRGEHGRAHAYVAGQHEQHQRDRHAGRRAVSPPGRRLLLLVVVGRRRRGFTPVLVRPTPALVAYQRHSARRPVHSVVHLTERA